MEKYPTNKFKKIDPSEPHKIEMVDWREDGNGNIVEFCICGKRLAKIYQKPKYKHEK